MGPIVVSAQKFGTIEPNLMSEFHTKHTQEETIQLLALSMCTLLHTCHRKLVGCPLNSISRPEAQTFVGSVFAFK
jgi:hypothetical protein